MGALPGASESNKSDKKASHRIRTSAAFLEGGRKFLSTDNALHPGSRRQDAEGYSFQLATRGRETQNRACEHFGMVRREGPDRNFIESNNAEVDVDALMARLRSRVDELRDRPQSQLSISALSLRSSVFINSLEAHANIADQKTQIRTQWPSNIGSTFPFNVPKIRDTSLKLLAFLFKDQRHVNQALVAACREQVNLNRQLIEQLQLLREEIEALKARS